MDELKVTADSSNYSDNTESSEKSDVLSEAKAFAASLKSNDITSGDWFLKLFTHTLGIYKRNVRAEYFQQKYPGLPEDDLAEILISVSAKYAALIGGVTGTTSTLALTATIISGPLGIAGAAASMAADLVGLGLIQIRLVLDLAVIYKADIDFEDPEDVLMIFNYAMGITSVEVAAKGVATVTTAITGGLIRKYIAKGTLKGVKKIAANIGLKLTQRALIKNATVVASGVVCAAYNFMTTRTIAKVAQAHFKNRLGIAGELKNILSETNSFQIAFPAALLLMANADGEFSEDEKEVYKRIVSKITIEQHDPVQLDRLATNEQAVLDALSLVNDDVEKKSILESLSLMAISDGELSENEKVFLEKIASTMKIPIDLSELEARAGKYVKAPQTGIIANISAVAEKSQIAVKEMANTTMSRVKGLFGGA